MKDRGNYIEIPLEEPLIYKGGVYHSITLKKEYNGKYEQIGIYVGYGYWYEKQITALLPSWEVLRKVMRQLLHNDRRF